MGRSAIAIKLTYLVSHPIQYQAPLLRCISALDGIDLRVVFENNPTGETYFDPGFKRSIRWDTPLTEGYEHVSLSNTDLAAEIRNSDVVWLHGWGSMIMRKALVLSRRLGKPVLMRGENCDIAMPDRWGPWGWLKRRYIGWILDQCSAFLAIGTENRNYYLQRGVPENKIFMMPYAIDNVSFSEMAEAARPRRNDLKAELGISSGRKVILYLGKFMVRKRADFLAEVVKKIDWPDGKPALVFVGEGEQENRLRILAPDAIFLGFQNQSQLPSLYDMADVLVVPSEREPWGLVVNEAMACATAVVVSDQVGCAADLVTNQCGRVFPSGDAVALADALVQSLEDSDGLGDCAYDVIQNWGFTEDLAGLTQALDYVMGDSRANQ